MCLTLLQRSGTTEKERPYQILSLLRKDEIITFNLYLNEAFTTRLHQKNMQKPSKKAKNTAAGTNILPQKAKVLLFFPSPPIRGNLPYIHGWAPLLRVLVAVNKC